MPPFFVSLRRSARLGFCDPGFFFPLARFSMLRFAEDGFWSDLLISFEFLSASKPKTAATLKVL